MLLNSVLSTEDLVHVNAERTLGQSRRRLFRCGLAFTIKPRVQAALEAHRS